LRTLIAFLALSSAAAAQVTVTGKVSYEDRTYNHLAGFTGGIVNRPVRQAEIELLDSVDSVLASGVTNETGDYSLTFPGPDQDVHIRVYARRSNGTGKINAVVRKTTGGAIYTVAGNPFNTGTTTVFDMVITVAGGMGGVFNIFDCAVKCFQYLTSAAIEPGLTDPLPPMTVFWQSGSNNGTYYDSSVQAIFLLGFSQDPDEYDDDIILHEMGHWVATNFSKDDTPGGAHAVTDTLDPRLSWSEGWAHYWSAAVRRFFSAEYAEPEYQVDTHGGGLFSDFEVEGPSFPTFAVMATNELAVAAVLWDLIDPANESFDLLSGLETEVWKSVHNRIPARSNITLEDFHEGLALEAPGIMADISGDPVNVRIFNARQIRYYADPSEPNSVATSAPTVSGLVTLRTFHGSGDQDWYTVAAPPCKLVVETLNLGDGADTLLQLWDATGTTLLASNNNKTSSDKSSRIVKNVSVATTFRIHVIENSPIVEFGYYDLQIQTLPKSGGGGGGGCGLLGAEAAALLGLGSLARRLRRGSPRSAGDRRRAAIARRYRSGRTCSGS